MLLDSNIIIYAAKPEYALIAATALVYDLELVTRNTKDFKWIPKLSVLNPFET